MRTTAMAILMCGLLVVGCDLSAQPPGGKGGPPGKGGKGGGKGGEKGGKSVSTAELVARLMAYDANKDGKLTKEELGDARLDRLFDRADANKDGVVTADELTALFTKEAASGGGPGGGGPGGFGPPGGPSGFGPPGGPGGFGPPGGPPRPGQILPPFLEEMLELTPDQKKQLAALQKEVDDRLAKILTAEQRKQLDEMRNRGPGGRLGGPGGPPEAP